MTTPSSGPQFQPDALSIAELMEQATELLTTAALGLACLTLQQRADGPPPGSATESEWRLSQQQALAELRRQMLLVSTASDEAPEGLNLAVVNECKSAAAECIRSGVNRAAGAAMTQAKVAALADKHNLQ